MAIYDLHAHSTASDGTLAPAELVARAAEAGVGTLALTDHDTTAGVAEAQAAATAHGLRLVPGIEFSASWQSRSLHIVGLNVDRDAPDLCAAVDHIRGLRERRAERIGERLAKRRIDGTLAEARALAGANAPTRAHFARVLQARGYGNSMDAVFRHYLGRGKPGYVATEWPAMEQVVEWIRGAGGLAVFAHPLGYGLTRSWLRRICAAFKAAGGTALEVATGTTSRDQVESAAALARRTGLAASCGSDFHDPAQPWIKLGRTPPLPDDLTPVWAYL